MMIRFGLVISLLLSATSVIAEGKKAYFGDLHVHTRYSFDAFLFGTRTSPDDAYRFAKGEAIEHSGGFDLQLDRPLDFYSVTDHAFYLGMWSAMDDPDHELANDPEARKFLDAKTRVDRRIAFQTAGAFLSQHFNKRDVHTAWEDIQATAERHNDPGNFTAFIGYEYTSARDGNLHRNVIYKGSKAPGLPFSRLDSLNPEDLWDWMDSERAKGIESLAIPHNSNGSNGNMFDLVKFAGEPLDADYAKQRMRNEPLVEITQVKGTSDTHPFLSPNDEWADFEIFPYQIARWTKSRPQGSYVREAWLNGLSMEKRGFNPYLFGVVGASDTHNSGEQFDESKFVSKVGTLDSDAENRGSIPIPTTDGSIAFREVYNRFFSAAGLAAVWAEENTRDAIFGAFQRKETFGTSGPRMKVRLAVGYDIAAEVLNSKRALSNAYANSTLQGGELKAKRRGNPRFLAWASADPLGTRLQRLQVIKGWIDKGQTHEEVFDVACSDGLTVDTTTHRCPDNGAKVDIADCSITAGVGAGELKAVWVDPTFDSKQRAFYYVRVLENPTCRWSTWDAVKAGTQTRPDLATTIQERAWTSPVWIKPH